MKVQQQQASLRELLAPVRGLRHLGASGSGQAALAQRKAVHQLLHSLSRLGRALADCVTPEDVAAVRAGAGGLGVGEGRREAEGDGCRMLGPQLALLVSDVGLAL